MTKSTELTLPQRAAVALGSAEHEAKLKELAAKNADIVEIKNGAGRDQCHGAMMVLANGERQARVAREAEEKRLADERAAQEAALRAQREAHERQLAAERAEAARIASERLAAESAARAEADRIAREKLAAEEAEMRAARAAQEAETRRLADERAAFDRLQAAAAAERRLQEEAARAVKEAADTQIRNAAPLLLEACISALTECPDLNCAAQLRTAIDAATVVDAEFEEAA